MLDGGLIGRTFKGALQFFLVTFFNWAEQDFFYFSFRCLRLDVLQCNPKRGEGGVCYERNVVVVFATSVIWVAKQLRMSLFFYKSSRKKNVIKTGCSVGIEGIRGAHTKGPRSFSKVVIDRYKMVVLCKFLVVGILSKEKNG